MMVGRAYLNHYTLWWHNVYKYTATQKKLYLHFSFSTAEAVCWQMEQRKNYNPCDAWHTWNCFVQSQPSHHEQCEVWKQLAAFLPLLPLFRLHLWKQNTNCMRAVFCNFLQPSPPQFSLIVFLYICLFWNRNSTRLDGKKIRRKVTIWGQMLFQ